MTGIRHFTASAIVFDEQQRVLFVHHNKLGQWLYPGGHIDPNEDPAQAALRKCWRRPASSRKSSQIRCLAIRQLLSHPPPYAILEMQVSDSKIGTHQHIDHLYVLRATSGQLTAQREEVSAARWVPIADIAALDTPEELPSLVADASQWAKDRG